MKVAWSTLLCAMVAVSIAPVVRPERIFGAETAGRYWGAIINPEGRAANVKFPVYPSFNRTTGAISNDPTTGQNLFELFEPHSIAYGPVCQESTPLKPEFLVNITDALLEAPELGEAFSGKAKAFTLYNSKIYFLYYGSYMGDTLMHKFQVRVLQSCDDCGVDPYTAERPASSLALQFTVKCSDLVVELPTIEDELLEFDLGNVLKVVGSKDSDNLDFYFQIGRLDIGIKTEMLLYHANSDGESTLLHTQQIDNRYGAWDLRVIGAVDYLDGVLCWTTADQLFCRYDDETHIMVASAGAITKGICKGTDPEHLADLSGVAVLQGGSGDKVILFGCSPQTRDIKGAGIIRVTASETTIEPLMAGEEKLSAASLTVTRDVPESCSFSPRPTLCVPLEMTTTAAPTTAPPDSGVGQPGEEPEPTEDPKAEAEGGSEAEGPDGEVVVGGDGENKKPVGGTDNGSGGAGVRRLGLGPLLVVVGLCWLWS